MLSRKLKLTIAVTICVLYFGCRSNHSGNTHDEHEGHAHNAEVEKGEEHDPAHTPKESESDLHDHGENNHEGHGESDHEEHGDQEGVVISAEALAFAGITVATMDTGNIAESIMLPGEIGFNEDRLVHITPRFPGIAKEARFRVGEYVNAGDITAVIESNESLTQYTLKAPISGRIIEKHIAPGEHVSGEESVYLLADLSNVWVNLTVYPTHALKVRKGQKVTVTSVDADVTVEGVIDYVTPVMDIETRTIKARVVLSNRDGLWRPGSFVRANIMLRGPGGIPVIEKEAVQILNNKSVVFIQEAVNRFKPVEVTLGESDQRWIHIVSGLTSGDLYVNKGAFEIKAKIVTSSLGEHAGHGH